MRTLLVAALACAGIAGCVGSLSRETACEKLEDPLWSEVVPIRAVAHRGLWDDTVAENTVEAIRRAYVAGAACVETDFHLEKDGTIRCYHDRARVEAVKAKYAGYRMPTLEEVLAVVPKDREIQAEIKTYGPGYAEKFVAAVAAAGLSPTNVTVSSFDYEALKDFKARSPQFAALWLVGLDPKSDVKKLIADAKAAKFDVLCPGCRSTLGAMSPKDADAVKAAGLDFRVFGVNRPTDFRRAIQLGATGFTTDRWREASVWAAAKMPRRGYCAHRGDRASAPENTPEAIRRAIAKGAAMVEFDIQRCGTGELVVMHDLRINRTTTGKGDVIEMPFEKIRSVDAGVKAGEQFRGTKVPTLREVLDVIPKEGVWINFHCYYADRRCIAEQIGEILTKEGRLHQGILAAYEYHIGEARAKWPDVITCDMDRPGGYAAGWTPERIRAYIDTSVSNRCDSLQFFCSGTAADFEFARRQGLTVNYFVEDDPAKCEKLFEDGVDFILVNDLDSKRVAARVKRMTEAEKKEELAHGIAPTALNAKGFTDWPSPMTLAASCDAEAIRAAMAAAARELSAKGVSFVTVPEVDPAVATFAAARVKDAMLKGLQGNNYADLERPDTVMVLPEGWEDWSVEKRLLAKARLGEGGGGGKRWTKESLRLAAEQIAEKCIVLLENDGTLPTKSPVEIVEVDVSRGNGDSSPFEDALSAIAAHRTAGRKVVAVAAADRPVDLSPLKGRANALFFAGHPGAGGAAAVERLVSGAARPTARVVAEGLGYPLGHGLGYDAVSYAKVTSDRGVVSGWEGGKVFCGDTPVRVSAELTNAGKTGVVEPFSIFVNDRLADVVPVALKPGETKKVETTIPSAAFGTTRGVPVGRDGHHRYAIRIGSDAACTNRLTAVLKGLVFADEFEGALDTNVWHRLGKGGSPWNKHMSTRPDLVEMRDGCLVLVGKNNTDTNSDPRPFLTGGVWNAPADAKTMMTYGLVEIRAKFEDQQGAWPAFWMLAKDRDAQNRGWPWNGEIDIIERLNADPFVYQTAHSGWTHAKGRGGAPKQGGRGAIRQGEFNVYGLRRTPTALIWYVNGVETFRYEKTDCGDGDQWPFTTPFYFLLDMQLGGDWAGKVEPKTLPVRTWIDWIRVYADATDRKPPRKFVAAEQKSGMIGVYYDYPDRAPVEQWLWAANGDPNVRKEDVKLFGVPDECKFRENGRTIIMNDSCGGAAGLDVPSGLCKWYVNAGGNPHSVELLPDGRVAVASSTGATLKLFDVKEHPFAPTAQTVKVAMKLEGGHGLHWDAKRNSLFALGYHKLYELDYDAKTMSVKERRSWDYTKACVDAWGHDLLPDGKGGYFFTNHAAVWRIDPDTGKIEKARDLANVKAFSPAKAGDLVTIPRESWWTDTLLVLPAGSSDLKKARQITLPGARFYKARWEGTEK